MRKDLNFPLETDSIPQSVAPLMRRPPNAGKGRKAGVPNRLHADLKQMILSALHQVGGEAYLAEQARSNPAVFLALLSKLIPRENSADYKTGLTLNVVTGIPEAIEDESAS